MSRARSARNALFARVSRLQQQRVWTLSRSLSLSHLARQARQLKHVPNRLVARCRRWRRLDFCLSFCYLLSALLNPRHLVRYYIILYIKNTLTPDPRFASPPELILFLIVAGGFRQVARGRRRGRRRLYQEVDLYREDLHAVPFRQNLAEPPRHVVDSSVQDLVAGQEAAELGCYKHV